MNMGFLGNHLSGSATEQHHDTVVTLLKYETCYIHV